MVEWIRSKRLAALGLVAACACVLSLLQFGLPPHAPSELLSAGHDSAQSKHKADLLLKMRSLLQEKLESQHMLGSKVQALIAAAAMKEHDTATLKQLYGDSHAQDGASFQALASTRHWKASRSDWKPYDPTKSLAENRAENAESPWGSREDELGDKKSAKPSSLDVKPKDGVDYARYEGKMRHVHGHAPCKNWGSHPIDCIREAFGNHLKGTKFEALRRQYDGRVTEDSLKRERSLIAKRVAKGYLSGALPVPKHGAVHRWVAKEEAARSAAEEKALDAAVAREAAAERRRLFRAAVAKEWGTGVAAEGPDAGKRYYINYKDRSTSWEAPAYVKEALRAERRARRVAALKSAARESQLYEAGFRAAAQGPAAAAAAGLGGEESLAQRAAAQEVIARFIERKDGVSHVYQLPHAAPSNTDLAGERARIARLLGVRHLVRRDPLAAAAAPRRQSLAPAVVQSKVIVDAYGQPVTSRPEASDYPTGQPAAAPMPAAQASPAAATAPAAAAVSDPAAAAAVVKAYEAAAAAAQEKAAALQQEVSIQQALIKDLEGQIHAPAGAAAPAAAAVAAAAPVVASAAAPAAAPAAEVPLGSFAMADYANSDEGGMMGTDVAYLSGSPFLAAAGTAAASASAQRPAADDAAQRLEADAARVAADRARVAADEAAAGELGTMGAAAPIPLTGEAGADEVPLPAAAAAAEPAQQQQEQEAPSAEGGGDEGAAGDAKPELGSWEMAKFANNVEAGGGSLGTNVAWMYDSLAKRGHYRDVEEGAGAGGPDDDGFLEYKAPAGPAAAALAAAPRAPTAGAAERTVLSQEAGRLAAEVNRRQAAPVTI